MNLISSASIIHSDFSNLFTVYCQFDEVWKFIYLLQSSDTDRISMISLNNELSEV